MPETNLFTAGRIDGLNIRNRILMAPMTRNRARAGAVPSDIAIEYYTQRATAGLIISEGTAPSPAGLGYARTPTIQTTEQIAAWKRITDSVHAHGGKMFLQLMHVGRIGHSANRLTKDPLVAPSAIRAAGQIMTEGGLQDFETPRALEIDEIPRVIGEYGAATRNALEAGFDGVELHCGSGYLPMQFLSTGTNRRTDRYGGTVKNRLRFALEVLEEMVHAAGASSRISIKISPALPFNDITDDNPIETYIELAKAISPMRLAFLHAVRSTAIPQMSDLLRSAYSGVFASVGGFDRESANVALSTGQADFVLFGKLFTSNPDLPDRFARNLPLTPFDTSTFYTAGPKGYIDYAPWSSEAGPGGESKSALTV